MGRLAFSSFPFPQIDFKGEVPCTEAQLTTIFKDHDTNGDGKLSRSELDLPFKKLGSWPWFRTEGGFRHAKDILPCSKPELRTIFKKHDDNKDGKLSWAEVKAAYKELGSHWPWLVTEDGFRHADLDDNGYIDIETELELLVAYAYKRNYIYKPAAGKV